MKKMKKMRRWEDEEDEKMRRWEDEEDEKMRRWRRRWIPLFND